MKELNIKIAVGIGDLIYYRSQLDATKTKFNKINISPNLVFIKNKPKYKDFLLELMKIIFHSSYYNITMNQSYCFRSTIELWKDLGCPPQKPNLIKELCIRPIPDLLKKENYIAIHTKARALPWARFQAGKKDILNKIKQMPARKIVILGEREIEYNKEYKRHGSKSIYSIYSDIMSGLPRRRIIDLTIPKLGITPPDIEKFLVDCAIINGAKKIICFGGGGGFCISSAIGNILGWTNFNTLPDAKYIYHKKTYPNTFVTDNLELFLSNLNID